jgi:hypothetical protein
MGAEHQRPSGVSLNAAIANYADNGRLYDRFVVHKFGKNPTVAAGDAIWATGGAYPYLTYTGTALAMRIAAGGDAEDDSGGDGARTVTIQGLDENFQLASETVTTNGTGASSATTTTFSRVFRAFVATAGDNRVNTAAVAIEDSGGSATYATILAGESQTQVGFITVPAGYRMWMTHVIIDTAVASASATLRMQGWRRNDGDTAAAPFPSARVFLDIPALSRETGSIERNFEEPVTFEPKTDIWFEGTPSTGTPEASVQFSGIFERIIS